MRLTSTLLLAGAAAALVACGKGNKADDTTSMGAGAAADTTGTMGGAAGAGAAGAAGAAGTTGTTGTTGAGAAGAAGAAGTTTGAMSDSMRDSMNRTGTSGTARTRERTGTRERTHRP